jgi:hypothetical protein
VVVVSFLAGCGQPQSQDPPAFDESQAPPQTTQSPAPPAPARSDVCADPAAELTARAYVLSMPLLGRENELIPLMEENSAQFAPEGGVIRCMQALGGSLVRGGLALSREFSGSSAQDRFGSSMPSELAGLPGQVDRSLSSYGSDQYSMGQELLWLARVLPEAARGNPAPFNAGDTTMRQAMAEVLPQYRMLCQMDASMCQLMVARLSEEVMPAIERQIYALARQLGG